MVPVRTVLSLALLFASPLALCAQPSYPSKPVRLIVGFAPGGGSDILARALGQPLGKVLGQQVIVDNRPGAGGVIAADLVAKAPADGHTLVLGSPGAFAINPNLRSDLPYHPVKDFAPVAQFATLFYVVGVHPSMPAKSLAQLLELAKARPGDINYGSSGRGANIHLSIEQLALMADIKMTHIPYKGNAPMLNALMGGEVALVFDPVVTSAPLVKSGKMRALAVTSAQRSPLLPDVPTVSEAGVPGYEATNWFAVFAPAGTPQPVLQRLSSGMAQALASPGVKERFLAQGVEPVSGTPAELASLLKRELDKFAKVIRAADVRLD